MTLPDFFSNIRFPVWAILEPYAILATSEGLPGRLVGSEGRFFKAAIQQWLSISQPSAEMRKAALVAAAGAFKADPDLEDMVEEIYRRRGRPAASIRPPLSSAKEK